jgi:hypothetical protein
VNLRDEWRIDGKVVPLPEDHPESCECEQCEGWNLLHMQRPDDALFDEYE